MIVDVLTHYETIATQSGRPYNFDWHMGPGMMGWWGTQGVTDGWQAGFWIFQILALITWILIVVALIALIRWLWKKGDKV